MDENLKDLEIPLSLLMKVYLLRCNNNYDLDCTTPGGMVTDFNMWDRSFTPKELQDWTSCRYRKHSFQLSVVVVCTCSVLYQLVSPSLAHATPT